MEIFNPVHSVEGTATTTGTTGVLFPIVAGMEEHLDHFSVKNLGSVAFRFKKSSLSTGPDAANNTDGTGIQVPAGAVLHYRRSRSELYFYVATASGTCAYSVEVGRGQ